MKTLWRQLFRVQPPRRPRDRLIWSDDGRRPNDGPPDLEEYWQRLTRFLRSLLPGGLRGSGGPGAPMRQLRAGLLYLGAFCILVWLSSGIYSVPQGSVGVVTQLGSFKDTHGPGWWYRLPAPFQSVEDVQLTHVNSTEVGLNTLVRATNLKDSSMLTADGNIFDLHVEVQWRVKDARDYLFNSAHPDVLVHQVADSVVRSLVGRSTVNQLLSQGHAQLESSLLVNTQKLLDDYHAGISVTAVNLQSLQPPEQAQAAFDDALKAKQDAERDKNDGLAYANTVIPRARGDAARILANAEGYRTVEEDKARGDAERFKEVLGEYVKAPAVTRERLYLQTMQDILSNSSKVLVDGHGSTNLYLPANGSLPTTRPATAPEAAPAQAPAPAAGTAAAAPPAQGFPSIVDNSRDPTRAREREQR